MPYIVTDECILCGACVVGCPSGAIEEGETKCEIDIDVCIECGTCEQNCPSGAIIFVEREEPEPSGSANRYQGRPSSWAGQGPS